MLLSLFTSGGTAAIPLGGIDVVRELSEVNAVGPTHILSIAGVICCLLAEGVELSWPTTSTAESGLRSDFFAKEAERACAVLLEPIKCFNARHFLSTESLESPFLDGISGNQFD